MSDQSHTLRPGLGWLLMSGDSLSKLLLAFASTALGGGVYTGMSLPTLVSWIVVAAVVATVIYQVLRILPAILRELVLVAVAVLCGIVAAGWCLSHADECGAFSASVTDRVQRVVRWLIEFLEHLTREVSQ